MHSGKRKVIMPKQGGIDTFTTRDIAWTGGNPYDNNITSPAANSCYRPMELDKAHKVEDKCIFNPYQRQEALAYQY